MDGFSTDVVDLTDNPAPAVPIAPPPEAAEPVLVPLPPAAWTGFGTLAFVALIAARMRARRRSV